MELYMACVLVAIALGILVYKGLLFAMFLAYPLPGETRDLKWKRSPSLPLQELGRRFGAKNDKIRRSRGHQATSSSATSSNVQAGASSSRQSRERQPLAHSEIQMESITVEEFVITPSGGRDNFGTVV
ncbi:hypothetical protein HDE_13497 [Halotydeus destructor]|nr:hypothetical protein HDE_13497 [Halotydeus destructor]